MSFRYTSEQVRDIATAAKIVRQGQKLKFQAEGEKGRRLQLDLDLRSGPLTNLRLCLSAGRYDDTTSYRAALLLDDTRIRGLDFSPVARKKYYKTIIPKGWHENVIDPSKSLEDMNLHQPMPDFSVTDLQDFLRKVSLMWGIDTGQDEVLL